MGLLEKIENLINMLLLKLGELIYKLVPRPVKEVHEKYLEKKAAAADLLKRSPALLKPWILNLIATAKTKAAEYNIKARLTETYKKALAQYKEKSPGSLGRFRTLLMAPVLIFGQWLKGLSAAQSLLLMTFTGLSILAIIGIGFSGQKLAKNHLEAGRAPASTEGEEDVPYERPEYYKKQTKFFEITSLRLPVYAAGVNELKSVDVDFIATLTNRSSKQYLEKNEFRLRDHLILQIEPSVATFPLTEEGREIIRRKILIEINDFLKANEIQGEVTELKITYVLAN